MDTLKQRIDALSPAKQRLIELRRERIGSKEAAIIAVPREGELPLSFAQQRQWWLNQFAPNSPVYNSPEVLCSQNNAEDVWSVFEGNPSMALRREHIASRRINWQTKSENLRAIASEDLARPSPVVSAIGSTVGET